VTGLLVGDGEPVEALIDGTLFRRREIKVWAASWFHDGSAQGPAKTGYGNYADPPVMPAGSATALVADVPGPLLTA
jgi:hypothetical protein